jgi:hypothetical protein
MIFSAGGILGLELDAVGVIVVVDADKEEEEKEEETMLGGDVSG